jgi:hypothetical protein
MTTDIATLGLAVDARPVASARAELERFTRGAGQAEGATQNLGKATDVLKRIYGDMAKAYAAFKIAEHAKEMAMLAARYETMGVVMRVAGNNAGYTNAKMLELQKGLQATGISMLQSRNALTQLSTANIDLSRATDLARAAQNLAVVANVNSSEALGNMIHAIKSGSSEILQTMGLNVSWEAGYKTLAGQLKINADKLTEQQKVIARTNIVMKEAASYNGIYEESLTTAGKQLASLTRYIEDFKVKAGEIFLPVLTDAVRDFTEAMKASNAELGKMGDEGLLSKIGTGLATAFRYAFEAVTVLGANVAFTFESIGAEIGGIAAQAALLFKGDFAGVKNVHTQMVADAETRRAALDKFEESILKVGRATEKSAEAEENEAKAAMRAGVIAQTREQQRIAEGEARRKEQAQQDKLLQQQEEAHKAAEKMKEKYKDLIKAITEKTAAEEIGAATQDQMTDGQKYAAGVLDELRTGTLKLTAAEKIRLTQKLEEYLAAEKAHAAAEAEKKAYEERVAVNVRAVEAQQESLAALRQEVEDFGLSTQMVNQNTIARLKNKMATAELDQVETTSAEMQIRLLEQQNEQLDLLDAKKLDAKRAADARLANEKVMQDRVVEAKRTEEVIDKTFHDGFVAMLDKGSDSWNSWTRGLRTTFKATVADEIYKMFAKPFIVQLVASMGGFTGGGFTGGSNATGSGTVGSTVNAAQSALGLYKAVTTGFAGIGATIGNGISSLGQTLGSNQMMSFGSGMNGFSAGGIGSGVDPTWSSYGNMAGTVASYAAPVAAAVASYYAAKAISGGYKIEGIGTVLNYGGVLGGLANRAFGMGPKETTATGVRGTISSYGVSGESYANWHQNGGWFRSDRDGTNTSALGTDLVDQFRMGFDALKTASKGFAESVGASSNALLDYSRTFDVKLTGDAQADQKAIADLFQSIGDEMANQLVPGLSRFSKTGETASGTLQRLSAEFNATNQVAMVLGKSVEQLFGSLGLESATARSRLLDLVGGIDNLSSYASTYASNFMTEAERLAPVQDAVTKAMRELGYANVTTREQFKAAVDQLVASGAVCTEAGAKTFAGLMAIAGAFAQVTPALEDTAKAAQSVADARDALSSAYERESKALQDTITHMGDFARSMRDLVNSSKLGSLTTLTPQEQYVEARKQFEATLAAAKGGDVKAQDGFDSAYNNFLTLSQRLFASSYRYEADFKYAQQQATALATLADSQVTDAMRQQEALDASVAGIIDVKTAVLSVRDAIERLATSMAPSSAASITAIYQDLFARAPDAQHMAYWQDQMLHGMTADQVKASVKSSQEYTDRPTPAIIQNMLDMVPSLIDLVKDMGAQIAGLRADQQAQTGDLITAVASTGEDTVKALDSVTPTKYWKTNELAAYE